LPPKIQPQTHALPPSLRLGDLTQHIGITHLKANHPAVNIQKKRRRKEEKIPKKKRGKRKKIVQNFIITEPVDNQKNEGISVQDIIIKEERGKRG
jgi:hypothetical protein